MNQKELPGKFQLAADVVVRTPAKKVWDVLADFSAADTWAPQVTKSYALGTTDRGEGAARHCDIKGFGSVSEVVTEWIEGRSFVYRVTPLGPLGVAHSRWSVREIDSSSSRVSVEFGYDVRFGVLGSLLHKLVMRPKLEAAIPQTLIALKARVETGTLVRPRRSRPDEAQLVSVAS